MNLPIRIVFPPWLRKYASTCSNRSSVIRSFGPWRRMNSRPSRLPMKKLVVSPAQAENQTTAIVM